MSKITVDELKVYLGTGLVFKCPDDDGRVFYDKIGHISEGGEIETEGGCIFTIDDIGTYECEPIVRPLSQITEEIEMDGKRFVPYDELKFYRPDELRTEAQEKKTQERFENAIRKGRIHLKHALIIASWHFDLHGWLNRTGEDGQPLAIEKQ